MHLSVATIETPYISCSIANVTVPHVVAFEFKEFRLIESGPILAICWLFGCIAPLKPPGEAKAANLPLFIIKMGSLSWQPSGLVSWVKAPICKKKQRSSKSKARVTKRCPPELQHWCPEWATGFSRPKVNVFRISRSLINAAVLLQWWLPAGQEMPRC